MFKKLADILPKLNSKSQVVKYRNGCTINGIVDKIRKMYNLFTPTEKYHDTIKVNFPTWCLKKRSLENPWIRLEELNPSIEQVLWVGHNMLEENTFPKNINLPFKGDLFYHSQIGKTDFFMFFLPIHGYFVPGNQTFMSFRQVENGVYTRQVKINLNGIHHSVRNKCEYIIGGCL